MIVKLLLHGLRAISEDLREKDATLQRHGVLIITETRVVFYRKGFLGEIIETIPLKSLTSIERKSTFGHRVIRMHASHDALEFKTFEKDGEAALIKAIENGRHKAQAVMAAAPVSKDDNLDKIKKLAELKEAGVLTEEEFSAKKEKLLAEI